jgi:putative oxidoreductase
VLGTGSFVGFPSFYMQPDKTPRNIETPRGLKAGESARHDALRIWITDLLKRVAGEPLSGLGHIVAVWQAYGGIVLRRLFSTFAQGWPGAGLLILRLAACSAVISRGLREFRTPQPIQPALVEVAAIIAGALLSVGLWTPIAGCLVAAFALWALIINPGDPWSSILLLAMGAALAMIGPGVWSLDARLFGWRRILIRDRQE